MKSKSKPRPKPKRKQRLARKGDREHAVLMVKRLQTLLSSEVGIPDRPEWERQLESVAEDLVHFAKYGTFDEEASEYAVHRVMREMIVPHRYRTLRMSGKSYDEAVEILAEEVGCSESTIRAIVPPGYSKRGPPFLI